MSFLHNLMVFLAMFVTFITIPISLVFCMRVVQEYQKGVILRLGRLKNKMPVPPGVVIVLPCIDNLYTVDVRTLSIDVIQQEALTKDTLTVYIDAVVYFRVRDPIVAIINVKNYRKTTLLLAMTTLRNVIGTKSISDILSERNSIAHAIEIILDEGTHAWGIIVERVEIKEVSLPFQLQRAMAIEAEASRGARAKVFAAEGELKSSRNYKEAADIMMQSPITLQLRYLQTLNDISAERHSTIVFPLPLEMMAKNLMLNTLQK